MKVDFHLHTHCSDGALHPAELLAAVRRSRLDHWAVTDHDTFAGWRVLKGEAGLVPAVEITAGLGTKEIHIVGLGVDTAHTGLSELLASIRALRVERMTRLIRHLSLEAEVKVDDLRRWGADAVGRNHLARVLVERGVVADQRSAFADKLGDAALEGVELPSFPSPEIVCAAVRAAGGVAILAHPGMYPDRLTIESLLDRGLDGLETAHPNLDGPRSREFDAIRRARKLFASCGSDLHMLGRRQPGCCPLPVEDIAPLVHRVKGTSPN